MRWESFRGRGAARGIRARRFVPYTCRARRPRGARIASYHSTGSDADPSGSDDSTQPPSHPWEPPCPPPMPPPGPNRESSPVIEPLPNGDNIDVTAPTMPAANQEQPKRRRGPAKCIEFEKARKYGKVLLKINDGEIAPCCENASMFTIRVTQIVKQHCDMSYARWTDVPDAEKNELIERVRGDFVLDWDQENHRLAVLKQLRKRFNAFHHELHKKYLSYRSHPEALASGCTMVNDNVWVKLCERWGTDKFKKISAQNQENRKRQTVNHTTGRKSFVRMLEKKRATNANLVEFYKETRWSKKNGRFVTPAAEDTYKEMVGKMDGLEPEQRTDEAAASVFREVLGQRPGYARGLGEMVIPESTRQRDREREREYLALIEKHKKDADNDKKDADNYKTQLEEVRDELRELRERQNETDKMMRMFLINFHPSPGSLHSSGETQ
ncbi:uncharacterized protein LOC108989616 [Juglans regia]|uniref:Uncharacterized protein LOC108989616 n=2 Tax=Juglans regia TaxID=51240 RepID=A0A6P9E0C5_JUGRE|nr:uncharacterized protein LOC108989616 [Juglans regia]XP_035540949.1 uncharacterized protein LOC108989616 [Juglans regia]